MQISLYLFFTVIFLSTSNQLLSRNANGGNTHAITQFWSVHWRVNDQFLLPPLHLQSKQNKVRLFFCTQAFFSGWMKQPLKSWLARDGAHLPNMEHCRSLRGLMCRFHAHARRTVQMCWWLRWWRFAEFSLLSLMAPVKMCNPAPPIIPSVTLICLCNRVRLGH